MRADEDSIVRAFIAPRQQERSLALLSKPKGRIKFINALAHQIRLDRRFAEPIPPNKQNARDILACLRALHAPPKCYIISEWNVIDEREMELSEAIEMVVGRGMGTFLSCVPGRLAYFEGESPGERYILNRK